MTRLSSATRKYIITKALEKAEIPALEAKLAKDRYDWINRVRVKANGISDEKLNALEEQYRALEAQVPEELRSDYGLVQRRINCWPNLGGLRIGSLYFSEDSTPAYSVYSPTLASDDPLVAEWHELEARGKELADRRTTLTAQIKAVLEGITTIRKLLQVWPEAEELLPPNEQPVVANVPAVLVSSLNAAIGLPSEEAA